MHYVGPGLLFEFVSEDMDDLELDSDDIKDVQLSP
jgi:hypothetical protein